MCLFALVPRGGAKRKAEGSVRDPEGTPIPRGAYSSTACLRGKPISVGCIRPGLGCTAVNFGRIGPSPARPWCSKTVIPSLPHSVR
jgi:hypothetical protein